MLIAWLNRQGIEVHISRGDHKTVLGLIGDTNRLDMNMLQSLDIVDSVTRVSEPFKAVSRKFHPDDSVVDASGVKVGGGGFALIAGPCSVESVRSDLLCGRAGEGGGREHSARRRIQAAHLALLFPGAAAHEGIRTAAGGQARHRDCPS